jgi:hypothetical protein
MLIGSSGTQEILYVIRQYAETGINTLGIVSNVRKRKAEVIAILAQLVKKGHLRMDGNGDGKSHTYYPGN